MATKEEILETLKQVQDPEIGLSIVDLGLVYGVDIDDQRVDVTMTLTSPACPYGAQIVDGVKTVPLKLDGVDEVEVKVVWNPPWDPDTMMSDDAKDALGIF
jgi:metal-sulfur cluster biosynthetic enzyme